MFVWHNKRTCPKIWLPTPQTDEADSLVARLAVRRGTNGSNGGVRVLTDIVTTAKRVTFRPEYKYQKFETRERH